MSTVRYARDVEEQLAEALPVLGQATLRAALAGLHDLMAAGRAPAHQKLLLWLWTLGFERFGQVTFGCGGPGMRLWFPTDGGSLALAVGEVELRVDIDAISPVVCRHPIDSAQIDADARSVASRLISQLERDQAKAERRSEYQSRRSG